MLARTWQLPLHDALPLHADDIDVLLSAQAFRQRLLQLIKQAKSRIYLTALYLQDDEAGRQIVDALIAAKQKNPQLIIRIFVDFHRAQRGLIGEKKSLGNRQLYLDLQQQYPDLLEIYGVPVKQKELLGVLHLKGFVIDDTVLYSGASLNNVYLHVGDKYRCDRYHQIHQPGLANSFVDYLQTNFIQSGLAPRLDKPGNLDKKQQKNSVKQLKSLLRRSRYHVESPNTETAPIQVQPLIGFGKQGNSLNLAARNMVKAAEQQLVIFTPYFNFPKPLAADLRRALKRGIEVTIVVGDKKANDFYIADEDKFSTIGIVPYLYEVLLSRFTRRNQKYIDNGQLNIQLWYHDANSFHLKGMVSDDKYHLLTGSNMNPRAWNLDIENGLFITDEHQQLQEKWHQELEAILTNTTRVRHFQEIETSKDYPPKVRELLRRIQLTSFDRLLKRFL
ncbi:CDP-diacylglycerol--serine O-phosphatidyltransferase [Thalassotalea mangrovi]|uniref:CDP-diacylglycerol--serine O-phosphatidyltransferase n=1 Tax=Thalassotalea mangrovi TaxID=2572245 RepID=A0A4U1B5J1_9GAMM|nr:CDP-diacylglycerol--serine O-phosphatidyltransferase [Thalassotalea mangrovi]TKB45378.1 CDP-diacylglycerol--serine O-phosphatidyltransferase [Thalassotalea mangrovi]